MSRTTLPPVEDEFTRALLRSAEGDEPSKLAYAKAAAELGLGVGVGLGVSASVTPAALAAGAAAVTSAARWSSSTLARFLTFGISGVLLVGGVTYWLERPVPAPAPVPAKHAAANARRASLDAAAQSSAAPPKAQISAPPQTTEPGSLRAALAAPRGPTSSKSHSASSRRPLSASSAVAAGATGSSLAEQVQSLDRARVALGSGDPSAALREISFYRGAWPKGVFLTEASVLEIEALAARGERTLAGMRARAFVAAHPDSPQADRLRALIPAEQP